MILAEQEMGVRLAQSRATMYKLLAKAFLYPTNAILESFSCDQTRSTLKNFSLISTLPANAQRNVIAFQDLLDSGGRPSQRGELESEYNRLFAHIGSTKCPPYETEYGYDNVFQKTQAMADIAGFYRAYQLEISDVNTERVDFISTELEFMSFLALNEAYAREHREDEHLDVCLDTQRKFLHDHLGRWITIFVKILAQNSRNPLYVTAGRLTEALMEFECASLGITILKVETPSKDVNESPKPFDCAQCQPEETEIVPDTFENGNRQSKEN